MYEDNAKNQIAGMESTTGCESKHAGREESLRYAVEDVRQVRQHLTNLIARITGSDTEPFPEESPPTTLADLLTQQPGIIKKLCEQAHENIANIESLLFD